jgi:exosortase/archaeosortase family protein
VGWAAFGCGARSFGVRRQVKRDPALDGSPISNLPSPIFHPDPKRRRRCALPAHSKKSRVPSMVRPVLVSRMSQLRSSISNLRSGLLTLVVLGFLWFTLINHLRIEWSVNPQYGYGWAVPVLCLFLIWRRAREQAEDGRWKIEDRGLKSEDGSQKSEVRGQRSEAGRQSAVVRRSMLDVGCSMFAAIARRPISHLRSPLFCALFVFLALAWLPTRLIQEANPEWRLISWALAIEVIGLTLLIWKMEEWKMGGEGQKAEVWASEDHETTGQWTTTPVVRGPWSGGLNLSSIFHLPSPIFPLLFFLVAVPWPTVIESPLVQFLMRTNAAATVEVVGWFGLPALQRGNIIEVGTGLVGIDDACSGIRSFQATLMIALFLGGLYRLKFDRRLLLVLCGCALAFFFNVSRTSVLVWIASRKGVQAMSAWHDPTGVAILVADFLCLWVAALALRPGLGDARWKMGDGSASPGVGGLGEGGSSPVSTTHNPQPTTQEIEHRTSNVEHPTSNELQSEAAKSPIFHLLSAIFDLRSSIFALAAWLVVAEVGTELWYRSHEAHLPKSVVWRVEFPRDNPTFSAQPFSDITKQFLRYDEGLNGMWSEGDTRLQVIFLRWNPGRIAPSLAKNHTPEVCLTAAGHKLLAQSDLRLVAVHGLQMPFRSYTVQGESGPIQVFYCLWEDRADAQSFSTTSLTYASRLEPVLAGRRNSGQRSLEIAMWGMADANEAEAALTHELEKLIRVGDGR